jgi:transcriptional regulator with XRE-family HTH domain
VSSPDGWRFGPYLADRIRDSGLSQRKVAQRAGISEGRVRQLIDGYSTSHGVKTPVGTTYPTIVALSRTLGFPLREGLELAGLDVPANVSDSAEPSESISSSTVEQLLAELGRRWAQLQPASEPGSEVPAGPQPMTLSELRARSQTITRLDALAREARQAGDESGADKIAALSTSLHHDLELADATEIRESRGKRAQHGE